MDMDSNGNFSLRDFLAHFDFDYDIVSPGSKYETKIREELLEDGDLSVDDLDKDLICLIDLQGAYFGDIGKMRYPINRASIDKIIDRMSTYINDSVLSDFEYELMARDVDCMGMSLDEMAAKCRELCVDEGCVSYMIADAICDSSKISLAELQESEHPSLSSQIQSAGMRISPSQSSFEEKKDFLQGR